MDGVELRCRNCGAAVGRGQDGILNVPCSACGSTVVLISSDEKVEVHELMDLKAKAPGRGKPFIEIRSGDELRISAEDWVHKERRIDRAGDRYDEVVTDQDGQIVHECHEPLSEHRGHGSARRTRKPC